MAINQAALDRLMAATFSARTFVAVMEQMSDIRDVCGAGTTDLHLDYQEDGDDVKAGELIPTITIGLRQATVEQSE